MSTASWPMYRLDNSFAHGALAYSIDVWGPAIHGTGGWIIAALICFGVFFMVPFALLVILSEALAGYLVGKVISAIAQRKPRTL